MLIDKGTKKKSKTKIRIEYGEKEENLIIVKLLVRKNFAPSLPQMT